MMNFNILRWLGDSAVTYQLGFQDPATTTMEGIYLFNLHLLFIIISILIQFIILVILELDNSEVGNFTYSSIREIVSDQVRLLLFYLLYVYFFNLNDEF